MQKGQILDLGSSVFPNGQKHLDRGERRGSAEESKAVRGANPLLPLKSRFKVISPLEAVPDLEHGDDMARIRRVIFETAAQFGDV